MEATTAEFQVDYHSVVLMRCDNMHLCVNILEGAFSSQQASSESILAWKS
jgi:hypothetical protein